jgi:segregation and condensation protein A
MMDLLLPSLEVTLDCYEGPLSALINLVKKNKVSIWDVSISSITERFLAYVEVIAEMNLRVAEDFIDMASLLLFIKARMLLPAHEDEEDDPRDELVERILEYEKLKTMARTMEGLPMLHRDIFCKGTSGIEGEPNYDLYALCSIFFELLKNSEERFIVVPEIRPTLEEKLKALREIIDSFGHYVWDMRDQAAQNEKVATVLGLLELTKSKVVTISQRRPFGRIVVKRRVLQESGG